MFVRYSVAFYPNTEKGKGFAFRTLNATKHPT